MDSPSSHEDPQPNMLRVPVFRTPVAGGPPCRVPRPGPDVGPRGVQLRPRSRGRELPSAEVRAVRCCGSCRRWQESRERGVGLCGLSESRDFKKTAIGMIQWANPWSYAHEGEECRMHKGRL